MPTAIRTGRGRLSRRSDCFVVSVKERNREYETGSLKTWLKIDMALEKGDEAKAVNYLKCSVKDWIY